jgi:hypothetical protein
MHPDENTPNLGEAELAAIEDHAVAVLGIGEGVAAVAGLEARIAGLLTIREVTEEGLEGPLKAQGTSCKT